MDAFKPAVLLTAIIFAWFTIAAVPLKAEVNAYVAHLSDALVVPR